MPTVSLFLITIAAIFLIGVIGELVFEKTGVPISVSVETDAPSA